MDTRIEIKTEEEWDEVISRLFELGWKWERCCNRSYDKYKERSVLVLPEDDNEIFLQFVMPRNTSADEWLKKQKPVFKVGQVWKDRGGRSCKIVHIEKGLMMPIVVRVLEDLRQHSPDGSYQYQDGPYGTSDYDLVKLVE
jgi:hypothetical protein